MIPHWKRKILALWFGQSISLLSSSVLQMSIIWYITQTTGSATILTCATLCGFFPQAVLGSFTGVFIDRCPKKRVLILSDGFIACASVVLGLVALQGDLPIWVIMVILVCRSIGTAFHEPAAQALTPLIVPSESLTKYAGYAQAFDSTCYLLSPALAILLYGHIPFTAIAWLDVAGAACAIVLLLLVQFPDHGHKVDNRPKIRIMDETKEGLSVMAQHQGILALMLVGTLYSVLYSPIGSLYPHIAINYFGATTTQSGIVEILFSVGSLSGALLLGAVGSKLPKHLGLFGSIFLYGLGIFTVGCLAPTGYVVFAILSLFIGLTTPFFHGLTRALYQLTIPPQYLGRAFALSMSARRLGMPVGLLLGGPLADTFGINVLCLWVGGLAMTLATVASRWPSLRQCCKK